MSKVKVGSRGSKLALWQTDHVMQRLAQDDPLNTYEKVIIKTKGDKLLDVALSKIGDKGLFTKEIEHEILSGAVDLAVHSMKDLPTMVPEGLMVGAVLARENPRDVLLAKEGLKLADLPKGARIGTSSLRRRAQLMLVRQDLDIVELRGNIDTRIKRLLDGELDAIILAYAGVSRLAYQDLITEELSFLPAVGQGAIAIEIRNNDERVHSLVNRLDDKDTRVAVTAERAFLRAMEGGCQIPIGALAVVHNGELELEGLVADLEGVRVYRDRISGPIDLAEELGIQLARHLLNQGADTVLREIRQQEQ
ncbi:MAG: hydroxymethylbilane synthase [Ignavibacteriales bacterium]